MTTGVAINTTFERVTVIDSTAGATNRFARVRIGGAP